MYLSMWILADSFPEYQVDRHISSGEMCIRNASVLFESERYKPHTVYVSNAVESFSAGLGDVICINRNDYFVVHDSTIENVYEKIQDTIDLYEEWDLQVRDRIEEKCSLQEIADRGAGILRSMLVVMNAGFIVQAVSGKEFASHIPEEDLAEIRIQTGLPLSHVTAYGDFLKDHLNEKQPYLFTEPVNHVRSMTKNILINGWLWGFCFFSLQERDVPESKMQLFQVIYDQILHWSDRRGFLHERPEQNSVFMDLLTGRSELTKEQLWEYLNRLGWAETDEKYVCVLTEHYGNSLIYLRLIHQITQTFSKCYILEFDGMVVLVVNSTHLPIEVLTMQLPQILSGSSVHIGISYPFQNMNHLPQHLEQARIALENAQQRNVLLSFCSDCAISYTRNLIRKNQGVDLEHPILRQIRKYDQKNGTQYYTTLRNYIMEERSIQRTAEALHIHKNTLLYRIRRMQELFPMDLSDGEERMRLLLSFMLYSDQSRVSEERSMPGNSF